MAKNRAKAENIIKTFIGKILPGSTNPKHYQTLFDSMDDEEFDAWMQKLKSGEVKLCMIAPNQQSTMITVERNFEVAKELGHNFFEKIWMDPKTGSAPYLSNQTYLIVDLPLRRQAQLLIKKISIPENNRTVDNLSGQPVGESKGSKISYPELQILAAHNLDNCITELIKYRGGDAQGFQAMNDSIAKTGHVSLESIKGLGSQVQSTVTLSTYLTSAHISSSGLLK